MKDTPEEMKQTFLLAAEQFLECEQPKEAAICLQNSRETELVAHLYKRINQVVCIFYSLFSATWFSRSFTTNRFYYKIITFTARKSCRNLP